MVVAKVVLPPFGLGEIFPPVDFINWIWM